MINSILQYQYFKDTITKEWLLSNKFYRWKVYEDETCNPYIYKFPVCVDGNIQTLECIFKIFVDFDHYGEITINVIDSNTGENYFPFYHVEYGNYDILINSINKKIVKELDKLGIRKDKKYEWEKKCTNKNKDSKRKCKNPNTGNEGIGRKRHLC